MKRERERREGQKHRKIKIAKIDCGGLIGGIRKLQEYKLPPNINKYFCVENKLFESSIYLEYSY